MEFVTIRPKPLLRIRVNRHPDKFTNWNLSNHCFMVTPQIPQCQWHAFSFYYLQDGEGGSSLNLVSMSP